MSSVAEKLRYTPGEYLALERAAPFRSEYHDGGIYAMSGASREHNHIAGNFYRSISSQLADRPCEAFVSDMRVRAADGGPYTYPDVVAVRGEPRFEDAEVDTLLNPSLIVEVLSPSTERYDRGAKFGQYRRIESLGEYLLASQDRVLVERYVRQGDGWVLTEFDRLDDVVRLDAIGCEVALRDVYAKVRFPEPGPREEGSGNLR